jgi:hypothetical protein
LFNRGFSTENGDLSATTASNVNGPAPQAAGLPKWRKHMMDIKKYVAGLSIAGKLTLGVGIAAAAGGGAGTIGALPDPVQHGFARTFDPISPFAIPDPGAGRATSEGAAGSVTIVVPAPPATTFGADVTESPRPEPTTASSVASTVVATTPEQASTTAAPAPTSTDAPAPPPVGVDTLSLACQQNAGWTGVVCHWSLPHTANAPEVFLLKTGPDASSKERIWGDDPTSYVDVHADGTNTYTYQIEVRAPGGTVVGRSGTVTVTMVPVSTASGPAASVPTDSAPTSTVAPEQTSTTVAPAPSTTDAPAPPPAGVEQLSLACQQNAGWTGVVCHWSLPHTANGLEVFLLTTGSDASSKERIWGDNPTSYVDVHADGTNTYTYQIEVRAPGGAVVGRSGTVTVTMVPV